MVLRLHDFRNDLSAQVFGWERALASPGRTLAEVGRLSLEYSAKFRRLAIIDLLTTGESWRFFHELSKSGTARKLYLLRCQAEGAEQEFHLCSGRYEPLLDAIASGEVNLACQISALSPKEWRPASEHKEDYCYAQILQFLVLGHSSGERFAEMFREFRESLEGRPGIRLNICRALVMRDQPPFETAFCRLLHEWGKHAGPNDGWSQKRFAASVHESVKRNDTTMSEELKEKLDRAADRVFVEGLALLCLAGSRGISTAHEYPYCPRAARAPLRSPAASCIAGASKLSEGRR